MTDPVCRDARRDDIAAILALSDAGRVPGTGAVKSDPEDPAVLRAFERIAAAPGNRLVVLEQDDRVVGTLQITIIPGLGKGGMTRGVLESVHVHPDCRGQGLGQVLVEWAIAECKAAGCGLIQLTSDKRRADAHRFYERLGFVASHEGFKLSL